MEALEGRKAGAGKVLQLELSGKDGWAHVTNENHSHYRLIVLQFFGDSKVCKNAFSSAERATQVLAISGLSGGVTSPEKMPDLGECWSAPRGPHACQGPPPRRKGQAERGESECSVRRSKNRRLMPGLPRTTRQVFSGRRANRSRFARRGRGAGRRLRPR